MSKNTKIVIVISVAVLIIGVLIYLYIRSINKARLGKKDDAPAPTPTPTPPAQRTVGNPATCSWLNGTYPKLKTNEFNDIDGGAHNPQAQVDWKANNCDLMYH